MKFTLSEFLRHGPQPGAIIEIDPDESQFVTMLMKVQGQPRRSFTAVSGPGWDDWGDWSWTEYAPEAREALFAFERKQAERETPSVSWLEDQLMPRMAWATHA